MASARFALADGWQPAPWLASGPAFCCWWVGSGCAGLAMRGIEEPGCAVDMRPRRPRGAVASALEPLPVTCRLKPQQPQRPRIGARSTGQFRRSGGRVQPPGSDSRPDEAPSWRAPPGLSTHEGSSRPSCRRLGPTREAALPAGNRRLQGFAGGGADDAVRGESLGALERFGRGLGSGPESAVGGQWLLVVES